MPERDDDSRTARQISRGRTKKAGDRSATLARQLMKLAAPAVKKLELDDELREELVEARKISSPIARRRAERALAGALRRHDLIALADQLAKIERGDSDVHQFHLAEQWRARLIGEPAGLAAFTADFPGSADERWPRLIDAARRERDTGRPPGAGRALFREVIAALKDAQAPAEPDDADADADAEPDEE
jgi:ribosome-associated protein